MTAAVPGTPSVAATTNGVGSSSGDGRELLLARAKELLEDYGMRVADLGLVLAALDLPKTGKKATLVARALDCLRTLSDPAADRAMQHILMVRRRGNPHPLQVRCPCGVAGAAHGPNGLVQCSQCGTWQHAQCVSPGKPCWAAAHACERCRTEVCDPFWQQVRTEASCTFTLVGRRVHTGVTVSFTLTGETHAKLQQGRWRLRLACVQLDDRVPVRWHWPKAVALTVNDRAVQVCAGRCALSDMRDSQRDAAADITALCACGANQLKLILADTATYVATLSVVEARSARQVQADMLPAESLECAKQRVMRLVGGPRRSHSPAAQGNANGAGAQEDGDVQLLGVTLSLRDPLSFRRIVTPARCADAPGLACFDLDTFLAAARDTGRWQCPHSLMNTSVRRLRVDAYVRDVLCALEHRPRVMAVELSPDAMWRPVWPDGSKRGPWHQVGERPYERAEEGGGSDEDEDEAQEKTTSKKRVRVDVIELLD